MAIIDGFFAESAVGVPRQFEHGLGFGGAYDCLGVEVCSQVGCLIGIGAPPGRGACKSERLDFLCAALGVQVELADRVESDVDAQDPRLDLQLDRTRAILMQARIYQDLGDREKAVSVAQRFLEIWQQADSSLPDLEIARQITAGGGA